MSAEHPAATVGPRCTCSPDPPTPTQHRFFCPWREWWLKQKEAERAAK